MAGIQIKQLCKYYTVDGKTLHVLDGIDCTFPENKITVVLGRSGCGKTTLLRLVGGLETFQKGSIDSQSKKTAFVFQESRLMPWLDVSRNITFGLTNDQLCSKTLGDIIKTVGLSGFEKAYPHQLSGGMQQRVAIARALMYQPSFLLMDEPFAALDYFTREQMQLELRSVQRSSNCGILFVTHSIDEALLLAHQIIVIEHGRIKRTYQVRTSDEEIDLLAKTSIAIKKEIIETLYMNERKSS